MSSEREQIIDLTSRLVQIPSMVIEPKDREISDANSEIRKEKREASLQVLDLVDKYLGNNDVIHREKFEKNEVVSRLWGDKETFLNPKLLLSGHIDVVSAPNELFSPSMKDGKLFGRGTGDMKGHVVALITAYKKWVSENKSSKGVGLLLTSDEEVGGFNGTRYVIENDLLKPKIVFIPDGSFAFDIVDSQKAPHHFHVRVVSKNGGGHVSKAFEIDNPTNHILDVYSEMRKKYSLAKSAKQSGNPEDEWMSTFEMTVFKTGSGGIEKGSKQIENGANMIAEWAEAWFGWRWPLEVEIDGKKATYKSGLKDLKIAAKKHDVEILDNGHGFGEGCYTNPNAKFVQKWKGIIEPIVGHQVGFRHMHGATDGRHFYKYGSDVLVTSAINGGEHSKEEFVDIDSLVNLSEAIYRYQREMTK
jgi:succinyl-diaminopimelate desuccinylase